MILNPDTLVLFEIGPLPINATIVGTWLVMLLLAGGSWLVTRRLQTGPRMARWQNLLEVIVVALRDNIREIGQRTPERYLPLIGTLFLFIATANLLAIVPGFVTPTASLSTTSALAICVLIAVPVYGITEKGFSAYLLDYLRPTPLMLPFKLIGEFSRTIALALRLYGNIMSGTLIVASLLSVAPFLFPVVMQLLGLLTGMIQAYIFAVLAMVYIASAVAAHDRLNNDDAVSHDTASRS
jgi:F-type H+-transporting ATPase subunit a